MPSVADAAGAARQALERAGVAASDVDLIVTVSCTGVMIPSVDAYLAPELGLRPNVRRLPITELGCAAGAAGLTRAWEYLSAYPQATVLLIAVELPSLTFQRRDLSQANLISTILFGDGAAAAVITGRPASGPAILGSESYSCSSRTRSTPWASTCATTGFTHCAFQKRCRELIRERVGGLVDSLLARHSLSRNDMKAWVLHPGGQKLLSYLQETLGLGDGQTQPSWNVLRDYGNLSSASVLFVLHEWLARGEMRPGDRGLLAAFGPGFSAEMLLLQWT